ncbi:MAG: helix-turn-helix transcriptional regulator [Alistipes sp.]|nr:helix-turn-helix transcriptional regulator [Alistipes sp.]
MESENFQFFLPPAGSGFCPVRNVLDRFGDKWSLLVLSTLHANGRLRFSAIHRTIGDVSHRMLTVTLRSLEADGLVRREVFGEVPPRVEYSLTPKGESLMPHVTGLVGWAIENMPADCGAVVAKEDKNGCDEKTNNCRCGGGLPDRLP